ncbi:metalloendoproteinase 2-MMP-like [Cornus florida]|uniref:metalloendoproteinase 2-MMP-like n=1 Tax=Cornus florida TaxID=4283 RepID=UPI0028A220AA|nr:metalloendoproteinase 2-MMP-like [Cornus florida]
MIIGSPFDGQGGILVHASRPPPGDGSLHFDADERWVVGAVPGLVNGTNPHIVSHYSFFPDKSRRPDSELHLTYEFPTGNHREAVKAMSQAFQKWSSVTKFKFHYTRNYENAKLKIGFYRRDHEDRSPFDSPGGVLAHAFGLGNGRLHFDEDERCVVVAVPGAFGIRKVGLREIGHVLGLGHSTVEAPIMRPYVPDGATKDLDEDDIQGIKILYDLMRIYCGIGP